MSNKNNDYEDYSFSGNCDSNYYEGEGYPVGGDVEFEVGCDMEENYEYDEEELQEVYNEGYEQGYADGEQDATMALESGSSYDDYCEEYDDDVYIEWYESGYAAGYNQAYTDLAYLYIPTADQLRRAHETDNYDYAEDDD